MARQYKTLRDEIELLLGSRDEFERQRRVDPDTLTDIERAARFLYLQRLAFGGKVTGRTFGVTRERPSRFDYAKLRADLRALGARLAPVTIERLPYAELIARYDSAQTLFYLDPPYWGCEDDYGADVFSRADFEQLPDQLAGFAASSCCRLTRPKGRAPYSAGSQPWTSMLPGRSRPGRWARRSVSPSWSSATSADQQGVSGGVSSSGRYPAHSQKTVIHVRTAAEASSAAITAP